MRLSSSKNTIIFAVVIILLALVVSMGIFYLFKDNEKATRVPPSPMVDKDKKTEKEKKETQSTSSDHDISKALDNEKELLTKSGKYAGRLGADEGKDLKDKKEKEKAALKQKEAELTNGKINELPATQTPTIKSDQDLANMQRQLMSVNTVDDSKKRAIWALVYGDKNASASVGAFVVDEKKAQAAAQASQAAAAAAANPAGTLPNIEYYKKYKAKVLFYLSSENKTTQAMPFVAQVTQPGVLYNMRVTGKATPDLVANRFIVDIDAIITPDNKKAPVKGFATMIDDSPGVVSAVKRTDWQAVQILGGLAALESGVAAASKDQTTYTAGINGDVIAQQKAPNRTREAIISGASAFFGAGKEIISKNTNINPTLILEKNTPIYIYFML